MKATLTFDLENQEDRESHMRCVKSLDMALVLFEVNSNLEKKIRQRLEHNYDDHVHLAVRMIFEEIQNEMERGGINLDELIS